MDQTWLGMSATEWSAVGAIAAAMSVLVAIVIAVLVQRASRRNARHSQRVVENLEEMTRRGRRDDVRRQLQTSRDIRSLQMLLDEGRVLTAGRPPELFEIEKEYFTNPTAPLLTGEHQFAPDMAADMRRNLLNAILRALPGRFPAESPRPAIADLACLTRLSLDLRADTHEIAALVVRRSDDTWHLSDTDIRHILCPPAGFVCRENNIKAAAGYLYQVTYVRPTRATLINVLAGVSLAILDFSDRGQHPDAPLSSYVMLMQRSLRNIGDNTDESGMSIPIDYAVAVMVRAIGLCPGDAHLQMRAVEALAPVLRSFSTDHFMPTGIVAEHLLIGTQLLLAKHPDGQLADSLRQEVKRLIPHPPIAQNDKVAGSGNSVQTVSSSNGASSR